MPNSAGRVVRGNEDNFPETITMPDGTTYRGNQGSFPAEIRMPDGTFYRGRTEEQKQKERDRG